MCVIGNSDPFENSGKIITLLFRKKIFKDDSYNAR